MQTSCRTVLVTYIEFTQLLQEYLGPSTRFDFDFTVSSSLSARLSTIRLPLGYTHGPYTTHLDWIAAGLPANLYHLYHHDGGHLDSTGILARTRKWMSSRQVWDTECLPSARGSSSLLEAENSGTPKTIEDTIISAYIDLVVKRSIEDHTNYPLAFRVDLANDSRPIPEENYCNTASASARARRASAHLSGFLRLRCSHHPHSPT